MSFLRDRHKAIAVGISTLGGLFLAAAAFGGLGAGSAELLEQGIQAVEQEDYPRAFTLFEAAALEGDPGAQFALGAMYLNGQGVTENLSLSADWFRKAAEQGHAGAQYSLGNAYLNGRGVERDKVQALYWWQRAAEQRHLPAQFNLGTLFYFGCDSAEGKRIGLAWLELAASNGYEPASERATQLRVEAGGRYTPPWGSGFEGGEVQILTEKPEHFAIQLLSAQKEETVSQFLQQEALAARALAYRYHLGNELWFGVAYGVYPERASAGEALATMRESLKQQKPWIRGYQDIQDNIRDQHMSLFLSDSKRERDAE